MRIKIFCALIFLQLLKIAYSAPDNGWYIERSTHFLVYYKNSPGAFLRELVEKSEDYYNQIADDLGFRRLDFWLWNNRAKIYIYDNAREYQIATGQPSWSVGCAMPLTKTVHTYPYAKGFMDTILPHEMGHIIFREFVGFNNLSIPVWLDEGVASHQEKRRYSQAKPMVKAAIANHTFITLEELTKLNPESMSEAALVNIFYLESVEVVNYLIKQFGADSFVLFCQELRDKDNFDKALSSTYPFRNIHELDIAWQEYLNE